MGTFLFDEIIFGPVNSRRLGVSLGINLLPTDSKFCNFNCIYCECGWTPDKKQMKSNFHPVEKVVTQLDEFLNTYKKQGKSIDTITFAGNGEPTLHPNFEQIIEETRRLREQYFPTAKISVLSNATMLHSKKVVSALKRVDNRILKLDSAIEETAILMNQPLRKYSVKNIASLLEQFEGDYILQTMFLRGQYQNQQIDNTTETETQAYLDLVDKISPKKIMIYTIARDTPADKLEKISLDELNGIAEKLRVKGFEVEVSG